MPFSRLCKLPSFVGKLFLNFPGFILELGASSREQDIFTTSSLASLSYHACFFHLFYIVSRRANMSFIGVTVQITLKQPVNAVLQGRVVDIVAGQNITLEEGKKPKGFLREECES